MRARLTVLLAATLLVPLAAAASHTVTTVGNSWSPGFKAIVVGDDVTFTNGGGIHNWVSDSGLGSCNLPCNKVFAAEGLSKYHCGFHGTTMGGSLRVLPFSAAELVVAVVNTSSLNPQILNLRVDVQNQGDQPSTATSLVVEYKDPSGARRPIATLDVPALNSGQVASVTHTWRDGKVRVGNFEVLATVDPGNVVAEAYEDNNAASGRATFVVGVPPREL